MQSDALLTFHHRPAVYLCVYIAVDYDHPRMLLRAMHKTAGSYYTYVYNLVDTEQG
jgi:hypothetical protein